MTIIGFDNIHELDNVTLQTNLNLTNREMQQHYRDSKNKMECLAAQHWVEAIQRNKHSIDAKNCFIIKN